MLRQLAFAALPFAALVPAYAQTPVSTPEFVTAAAQSDRFEIEEGKLAESKGSAQVKGFGEHMVSEHTKTTAELKAALEKAGIAPPPPTLRPDQQNMIVLLQGLSGAEFDKAYLTQQIEAHRQTLAVTETYAKTGDTPAIKAAAEQALPVIEEHLQIAEKMEM